MATTYEIEEYDPTQFAVDPNHESLTAVKNEESAAITENSELYGEMMAKSDKAYAGAVDTVKKWESTQVDLQNEMTKNTIDQIEQQKGYAQKDYEKEQAGAYVDWRKQSNQYGAEAEKMAASGLANTGYSESSQVSMYNTYQNRIAIARESFQRTCDNFANQINEAKLQNSAALAEIYATSMEKQIQYSIEAMQYNNQLLQSMSSQKLQIQQLYSDKWAKVYDQLEAAENREFDAWQQNNDFAFREELAKIENDYAKERMEIEQDYKIDYLEAETDEEKKRADHEKKLALERLDEEYTKKKELAEAEAATELANAKELARYERSLNSAVFDTGNSGNSGSGNSDSFSKYRAIVNPSYTFNTKTEVSTAYYQGSKNPDASKYGTFSNGYQPKGISGHGKLSKTNKTITVSTVVQYGVDKGKKQNLVQTVWKAKDGTKWYWEGRQNKYIQIK